MGSYNFYLVFLMISYQFRDFIIFAFYQFKTCFTKICASQKKNHMVDANNIYNFPPKLNTHSASQVDRVRPSGYWQINLIRSRI